MTTITDTSVLHWLPFDDFESDPWKLAFIDAENQNWNSTDLKNGTTTLEKMAASKHGVSIVFSPAQLGLATGLLLSLIINARIWTKKANGEGIGRKLLDNRKQYQWILHLTPSASFIFASTKTFILHYLYLIPLIAFALLLPLLIAFLIILLPFIMYRVAVFAYLEYRKTKYNSKIKLLSGADAVWTFNESHESYSVINALLLLEGKPDILRLKEIFRSRFHAFPKLRMRRDSTLGYTTWFEDDDMDLGNLVQWLPDHLGEEKVQESSGNTNGNCEKVDYAENSCDCGQKRTFSTGKWSREKLSEIIEELCNRPLPEHHSVSWEARVGKAMEWEECSDDDYLNYKAKPNEDIQKSEVQTVFPILFRIHHSIGDGASLLQLMMSTLIDNESGMTNENKREKNEVSMLNSPQKRLISKTSDQVPEMAKKFTSLKTSDFEDQKDLPRDETERGEGCPKMSGSNIAAQSQKDKKNSIKLNPNAKEKSYLYGHRLSGKKIVLWNSASVTVEDVKKIRAATGVKFTDILLSAVSASLANYWEFRKDEVSNGNLNNNNTLSEGTLVEQMGLDAHISRMDKEPMKGKFQIAKTSVSNKLEKPPSSIKLVIPAILGSLFQKPKFSEGSGCKELENLFSVAIMTLPVGESGGCPLKRLAKVSDASGFMMPIRKESIIDYKSKLNNQVFSKKPEKSESLPLVPEKKKARGTTSAGKKHVILNENKTVPIENKNSTLATESSKKTGVISPHGSEVLTYYYTTKKSDSVPKIHSRPSSTCKQNSTVFYHKKDDSAKLIIHNKEPYSCPTTIFFTHKNQNSTLSLNKTEVSGQDERDKEHFGEANCLMEFPNEKREIMTSESKYCRSMEIEEDPPESNNERHPKSDTPKPPPSLNLPSSPTIQHLIMRWLALDIVATVIPAFLAAPMMAFASKGVAVVMSNLPGPSEKLQSVLGGHLMKDIVFWAPHRGFTGVGVTVISYDGKLEIGLMVDEAVVPTRSGAQFILNSVLDELHSLGGAVSTLHH